MAGDSGGCKEARGPGGRQEARGSGGIQEDVSAGGCQEIRGERGEKGLLSNSTSAYGLP